MTLIQELFHRMRSRERACFATGGIDPATIASARETLVGCISHDVNNLWARIIGYAHLGEGTPMQAHLPGAMERIESNSRRGVVMFRAVMEILRRGETGREPIDAASLLQDWESMLSFLPKDELEPAFVYPNERLHIDANRSWIDLLLLSFVSSIMAMAPHRRWMIIGAQAQPDSGIPAPAARPFEIIITHSLPSRTASAQDAHAMNGNHALVQARSTLMQAMGGDMETKTLMGCVGRIRLRFSESIDAGPRVDN